MFPAFYNRRYGLPYEPVENSLVCNDEKVVFDKGVPRFVNTKTYASLFGDQWKKYRLTQLDSYTGVPISANRLFRCLGPLKNKLEGKMVLEAGCGAGRFTEILLEQKAFLVSSDISSAVDVNVENFPITDRHIVIQADINNMPYEDETFDVVICLGVIQHTPSPERTIQDLYKLVKRGGFLIIDHYTLTKSSMFRLASVYRLFLRRQSSDKTIRTTEKLVRTFLPLHKKFAENKLLSLLLNRISPVITYYKAFPELNDKLQAEWALLDTHDSLTDFYKHFRSRNAIAKILENLGGSEIWCEYGGNGVEARCKKPL